MTEDIPFLIMTEERMCQLIQLLSSAKNRINGFVMDDNQNPHGDIQQI